jgi:hypothetical protein
VPSDKVDAFNTTDAVRTQIERFRSRNGTSHFLADYKDRWVRANKNVIRAAAQQYDIPAWVLAAVAWTEVGGDPPFWTS